MLQNILQNINQRHGTKKTNLSPHRSDQLEPSQVTIIKKALNKKKNREMNKSINYAMRYEKLSNALQNIPGEKTNQ